MTVWEKRAYKLNGFVNHVYSLALLRYTPLNDARLKDFFTQHPVERLHVGCGLCLLPGWLNVLYEPRQEYGRVVNMEGAQRLNYNLLKEWPWPDNSVSNVAGAHFIEHLDLNQGLKFCKQAFRVLRPGGVIRLSCPDLETYARSYINGDQKFFADEQVRRACVFKEAQTPSQIFAAKAYDSGGAHKWFHDFSSLKNVLERCGFVDVRRVTRLEGKTPDLEQLEVAGREIESLYIEAVKP